MKTDDKILRWNTIHAFLFCFLFILYAIFPVRYPVIVVAALSFLYYWLIHFDLLKRFKPFGGYPNWVTLIRLILILGSGIWYKHIPDFGLIVVGLVFFSLDGLDGLLARKFNQKSEFGAYFDLETDAIYVCVFTIILFEKGLAGFWIVVPGFMRYIYGVLIFIIGKKGDEETAVKYAPQIGALFFVAILFPYILPGKLYYPLLIISSVLLMLSFLYSFIRVLRIKTV
ncbi:MAG TPA: CDP-alcohol phosphatidyltransferase family protein [Draconibacterium sp.]|nr:CDP-alcohol phosphatidyltransferase family protein [Draconibacterium sp.]